MEITMSGISTKLRETVLADLKEYAYDLEKAGTPRAEIMRIVEKYIQNKKREFYKPKPAEPMDFFEISGTVICDLKEKIESKAEGIFYRLLSDNGIEFKFQYRVGHYRIDYLVGDDLVVELDGPQHSTIENKIHDEKRDSYLEKMGYRILRIPIWIVSMSPSAVLATIKENSKKNKKAGSIKKAK
jgi:very-short-patch-repair endonuclease